MRIELNVAPSIFLLVHEYVNIFLANLTEVPINVRKGQIIAFVYFVPIQELLKIMEFGTFLDIGLPCKLSVHEIFNINDVLTFPQEYQKEAVSFLNKFEHVSAKDYHDLSLA